MECAWKKWSECRPEEVGIYLWRLPAREYGGMVLRPEWTDKVNWCGMGFSNSEIWPLFSNWDGYERTVPDYLEWSETNQGLGFSRIPDVELDDCPFCGGIPYLSSIQHNCSIFGVYCPNFFQVKCDCGASVKGYKNPKESVDKWNKRGKIQFYVNSQ